MPIYEYSCGKCGEVIERIQKFSDPPLRRHSGCGGKLTKIISQSAFQLKGSGWYVTDYARQGAGKESGDKKDSGADKEGTAETPVKTEKDKKKSPTETPKTTET